LAAFFAILLPPAAQAEDTESPDDGLTVAILDLAEAPDLVPPPEKPAAQPTWRTSFGSERKSEVKKSRRDPNAGPLAYVWESDAVLIQGVSAGAPLRRLFPPKAWRLVVSRQVHLLSASAGNGNEAPQVTAIAVKAREGLRVTAREMSLKLDDAATATEPSTSATAVRILDHGRALWLASVALPNACGDKKAQCPAQAGLDAWRQAKTGSGEATLVGGRLGLGAAAPASKKSAACATHAILTELKAEKLPANPGESPDLPSVGCISILRLADR
jgi:hypothetical protein